MNLALVLGGKAALLAVWVFVMAVWSAYRIKRKRAGLPLRWSRRTQSYHVSDWTEYVETAGRWLKNAAFAIVGLWWIALAAGWLIDGKTGAKAVVETVFSWLVY